MIRDRIVRVDIEFAEMAKESKKTMREFTKDIALFLKKTQYKMSKKGFIFDYMYFIIMMFVLAIVLATIYFATSVTNSSLSTQLTGTSKEIVDNYENQNAEMTDWLFGLMFFGVFISLLIIAWSLRTYPILAGVMFLLMIITGILGVHFANAYFDFSNAEALSDKVHNLTVTQLIMEKYPFIVIGLGFLFIIVLLSSGGNQNQINV